MGFVIITTQAFSSYPLDNVPKDQGPSIITTEPLEIDRFSVNSAAAGQSHDRLTSTYRFGRLLARSVNPAVLPSALP
jgi:hypothetical protein